MSNTLSKKASYGHIMEKHSTAVSDAQCPRQDHRGQSLGASLPWCTTGEGSGEKEENPGVIRWSSAKIDIRTLHWDWQYVLYETPVYYRPWQMGLLFSLA